MPCADTATFKVERWDETPYGGMAGAPTRSRTTVTVSYTGLIEGEGSIEYLMMSLPDGRTSFLSQERIVGRAAGRLARVCFTAAARLKRVWPTVSAPSLLAPGRTGSAVFAARAGSPATTQVLP